MSHPARLSLRAPPHLPFVQGYPGIPGGKDRKQPAICGTVEVRVGAQPIKAKWVRVEIRKHESLPPGFPGGEDAWELVGEIITLWSASGTGGKEFDNLQTADFKFFLPLPETIPPTVEMMKGTGVWYELVAALSYRKKGGIFKADSANIMKISETIRITKHELHAVWPVYNNPDQKSVSGQDLHMTIARPGVAFGPGDRILLTATLRSSRAIPFKLRGFECTLLEVVTALPQPLSKDAKRKSKTPSQPVVKSRPIAQARCAVDESVGRGGEKSARIDMAAPTDLLVTVRHAARLEVGYELQVKAVCDGFEGPVVPGIRYVVGPYARGSAQQAIKDIGHVDQLCGGPRPSRPDSPSSGLSEPNGHLTPNHGFIADDPRRQSTSTITTTTTQDRFAEFSPAPGQRPFSTVPNRQPLMFPTAHPAPGLQRSASTTISDYSTPDLTSDPGHNRFSTATGATFGVGAAADKKASWDSAEREKMSLYANARQNAATSQQSAGIPLDRLGLADIPDVAPPEYAPPVPALPGGKYQPPARPVSAFTSPDQSVSSALASPEIESPASPAPPAGSSAPNAPSESTGGSTGDGTASAVVPSSVVPSGLSEKDQMRRYYEARDKVETRNVSASGSGANVKRDSTATISAPPASSGLSEKEQMRRYYEARDRVGAHAGPSSGPSGSVPQSSASASTPSPAVTAPAQASGLSEKEQMRRYYEARDRAEQAQQQVSSGSGSGSYLSPQQVLAPPITPILSSGPPHSATASPPVPPRTDQALSPAGDGATKERNEAAKTASPSASPRAPASALAPHPHPPSTPPPFSSPAGPSRAVPPPPAAVASSSQYESAADEKERMRRLYEEANQRVSRMQGLSSPNVGTSPKVISSPPDSVEPPAFGSHTGTPSQTAHLPAFSPVPPSTPPLSSAPHSPSPTPRPPSHSAVPASSSTQPYPSAEQEKAAMRKRFEDASSAVGRLASPTVAQTPTFSSVAGPSHIPAGSVGQSAASSSAPPPPLPSRPPADYINLLSPVSDSPSPGVLR